MRKAVLLSLLTVSVCLFSSAFATAQSGNSCIVIVHIQFGQPAPPGIYDCTPAFFAVDCKLKTNQCPPPNSAQETAPGRRCSACQGAVAGSPINLANGNVYIEQLDLGVPGLGGGLTLSRMWNSILPSSQAGPSETGMFGLHWRSNYEERVFVGSDNFVKYQRGDGSFWSFANSTSGVWATAAPANDASTLTYTDTAWTITFQSGEKRVFSQSSGSLTSIIDRNGNTTTLTYDGSNRLITVTDPAGRSLTFTYGTSGAAFYLVQNVTSSVGVSLSYTYTGTNLTQATKPDGTHITYEYNAQNLITAVKDNQGAVLESHTYDALGRGLTSSRANGVQAVTVTYPQ